MASVCLLPVIAAKADAQGAARGRHHHANTPSAHKQRPANGSVIEAISINGNSRIETSTVLSYMVVQPGDNFNQDNLDRSLKTLYATGLFKDVTLRRDGNTLVVDLVENPIVNRIAFEGNHAVKDEDLRKEIALRPRAVFSAQATAADRQKLLNLYASKARFGATVTPQIVKLSHNRVDVIFKINEAQQTLINKIVFVGNHAFSEARLAQVISSKETEWYRFFSSSDEYNPERIKYDAELLRRFYLHNGFVDFHMINATGELSPDRKSFYVTFTLSEGARYRIGKMDVRSSLRHVEPPELRQYITLFPHQWYDGTAIQNNATGMQERLQATGHPFAMVRSEIARNPEKHIVDLLFDVTEGPRVYVERVDINGNTITQDKVIRRQLPMAEGDPYTPFDRKYSKAVLQDLGYFSTVSIDQTQGSAPDRVNVSANVVEKPTGEFSLGGGYSTDVGILGNASVKQHNLLGTGIDAGISGTVAYYEKQVDLSVSDPYFLNRNLVAGIDIYGIQNNYQTYQSYKEGRYGGTLRLGYSYNNYLSQSWSYSLIDRDVGNFYSPSDASLYGYEYVPSIYVQQSAGWSLLSQLSTTLSYDRRDNRMNPRKGYMLQVAGDFAGLGGNTKYVRAKIDGNYYLPLDAITGSHDWTMQFKGGAGYMTDWGDGNVNIIDNFYLGGQNLRGFLQGGAGPRSAHYGKYPNAQPAEGQEDLLGGKFIYTASAQLNFPLPMGDDVGISGRYFVDAGGLAGLRLPHGRLTNAAKDGALYTPISGDSLTPRVSTGFGISWKSPFGLVNIDAAVPIHKSRNDRLYPIRFGFGQQF
ncbi:outer membrane protein [Neoasaia chiangmaiensis NBRC 101099]|uniref:Outer membrane protein assembly factor BamA n=1 Tax=Neoasaia chiangmaiensis TaxID=320497 RepID=A0A1U9KRI4_9PROT|nr:outer membrane protein assembly factor BamA [Neoasaia chiangmaiensis]AQS88355.1 outer membrane protein assembly factor BamA [Neoasaia chiangmaiensis]GBR39456.1 outer membrane protein [Neoasaia chiangmaiensis NBRC 101099]GEN14589.1 outer membrane protein assembly factor BamA [Neoasaia chiangmaiensis]